MKKGLLVIGHGSRAQEATLTFNQVVEFLRETAEFPHVEGAHMELSKPSIDEMVEKMVEMGICDLTLVPYFLYKGIHLQQDVPRVIDRLSRQYPDVQFKMAEPIGAEPMMAQILLSRARQAVSFKAGQGAVSQSEDLCCFRG